MPKDRYIETVDTIIKKLTSIKKSCDSAKFELLGKELEPYVIEIGNVSHKAENLALYTRGIYDTLTQDVRIDSDSSIRNNKQPTLAATTNSHAATEDGIIAIEIPECPRYINPQKHTPCPWLETLLSEVCNPLRAYEPMHDCTVVVTCIYPTGTTLRCHDPDNIDVRTILNVLKRTCLYDDSMLYIRLFIRAKFTGDTRRTQIHIIPNSRFGQWLSNN